MKTLRFFTLAAALLLAWGCGGDDNAPDSPNMTLRWDDLTHFGVSDIGRIDVTTAGGTRQCNVSNGGRFYLADPSATIESVTVHFTNDRGSIRVGEGEFTVSGTTLSIARDLSDVTLVYDRATLNKVRDNLGGNYLQIRDIDLSAGGNWTPIGGYPDSFTGTYDGGALAIRNMMVNVTNASGNVFAGLFGVNDGTLRNIHLEGGSVSGTSTSNVVSCGGVCGVNDGGTITACYNTGSVSGTSNSAVYSGGVCGGNSGTITACYNTGEVSGTSTSSSVSCGGVCGVQEGGTITACYNIGEVSGEAPPMHASCGGVCGLNFSGTITYCYWGGASASLDNAVEDEQGTTTETFKFGAGAWPSPSLRGWGGTAPDGWSGAWADPWESLGEWKGGGNNTVFPTLK